MTVLALDGMPRRLFAATPSRLTTWLDCPRRYRFVYVDRPPPPKGPPWAHNSLGSTVHNALKGWVTAERPRRTPDQARSLVDVGWISDGYRDDAQQARTRERAREMVAGYVATLDPDDEPPGVERTVAVRHADVALSGRVDRIDRRGDELVIVDYKTGRKPLTDDDARGSLALAIYAAAAARTLRRGCLSVELHHLPTGAILSHTHTPESLDRHLGRASAIAEEARAAEEAARRTPDAIDPTLFPARPSPGCSWCDFQRSCPEGRAAGPPRDPWSGLADDPT